MNNPQQPTPQAPQAPGISARKTLKPFHRVSPLGASKQHAMVNMTRQECFERGYLTVQDLDDEELRSGRCRDATGMIPKTKGKTELIPKERYDEMVAEHEMRFKQRLRDCLDDMIDVMIDIAKDDTVEPRERFEAAKYIFERTAGKTPETVNVNIKAAPWEDLLNQVTGIAPITRKEHNEVRAGVIDVEYEEQGEQQSGPDTQAPNDSGPDVAPEGSPTDDPRNPEGQYGRRADEKRSYAEQARAAQDLMRRRKEAKTRIQDAKKQRKIARAMGADAIKDEITGATVDETGTINFN